MAYPSGEPTTVLDSSAGLFDGSNKHILEFGGFLVCLTGKTPNPSWGHGKLDVYAALKLTKENSDKRNR